ncbi:unnamed protein product [Rhodiola kirilowii]
MEDSKLGGMIVLTRDNYNIWKTKMEDLLYDVDLAQPILNEGKRPEDIKEEEWKLLDRKALGKIRRWVDISVHHHVSQEKEAYKAWKKLESLYERKTANNKVMLIRKFVNMKYRDGSSMTEHLNEVQNVINQLTLMKIALDDEVQALLVLSSLPDSWETLAVSLSNSTKDGVLTMEQVASTLLNEESRRSASESSLSQSEALVSEGRGRSKNKRQYNNDTQQRRRSKSRSGKRDVPCYYCGINGHYKSDCRFLKRDKKNGTVHEDKIKKEETTVVADGELYVHSQCDDNCLSTPSHDSDWIIDSGASYHITSHKNFFTTYKQGDYGELKMRNSGKSKIVGMGDVHLTTNLGCKLVLEDVRHVPDIRFNLIAVGKLDDEGYKSDFSNGIWKLSRRSLIVAKGAKCCSLYKTQAELCGGDHVSIAEGELSIDLWHKRLGHMSDKGLEILSKRQDLPNLKGTHLFKCIHCLHGKQNRVSFKKITTSNLKKNDVLELVHTDVCGPMKVRSLGGSRYFVTFIDDASRKVWAYALKSKDQVAVVFKAFHAMVERETDKPLKCIRSDNGGEYIGSFHEYCKQCGIRNEQTVPKTPQHNGTAERMNRTIVEKMRCMLSHAKLPKNFWAEALMTAVHVINRSPSQPLKGDVAERVWSERDASYDHLKVFGCRAFVHIPKDERTKLDNKAKQCIFIGYGDEKWGYKLYDPANKKVIRSRDVVFLKDQTISDFEKGEKAETYIDALDDYELIIPGKKQAIVEHENVRDHEQAAHDNRARVDSSDDVPIDLHEPTVSNEGGQVENGDDISTESIPTEEEQQPQSNQEDVDHRFELRRSSRPKKPSTKYPSHQFVLLSDGGEPEYFQEALDDSNKDKWLEAMQEEMRSLRKNETYSLVEKPKGKRILKNKWIYKIKHEHGNPQPRYKARLVVKGFGQQKGVDYDEIFSPVVKMTSIRVVLGLVASMILELEQMDVKRAFPMVKLKKNYTWNNRRDLKKKAKRTWYASSIKACTD